MIKLPVKDPNTIPWMSKREIPAIKAVLSAWREFRKDPAQVKNAQKIVSLCEDFDAHAQISAKSAAWLLEKLSAIDEHMRKEARDAKHG